jgi:hypothetical protein
MAAATLLAIVAFVFLSGPVKNSFGPVRGDEVLWTTRFGSITAGQRETMRASRAVFVEFLQKLAGYLKSNNQPPGAAETLLTIIGGPTVNDADLVDKWIFAREADSMGLAVDDKTIGDFLDLLTNKSVSHKEIVDILNSIRDGVDEPRFLGVLREELLALRYRQVYHQIHPGVLSGWVGGSAAPGERWASFKRLNERATIELALFPTQDFAKQIEDPSAEKLNAFFDERKQEYASPMSPDPGFHVHRKVNIQYLQADADQVEVTDAEITQCIEQDPQKYKYIKEAFEQEAKEEAEAAKAGAKNATEKKPETDKTPDGAKKTDTEKKPDAEKKNNVEKKPEAPTTAPAEPKPATDAKPPTDAKPATDAKPNAVPPPSPEPAKTSPAAKPSGSYTNDARSPFRLVAFADDNPAGKADQNKDEKKQPSAQPATSPATKSTDEKKSGDEKKPDGEKKSAADKKSTDEKPESAKKTAGDEKQDAKPVAAETTKQEGESKTPPVKIKTADERLRSLVREQLLRDKLPNEMRQIQTLLEDFRRKWIEYDAKENAGEKEPTPPDFGALALQYKMTAGRTGLLSQADLAETDVGKSLNMQGGMVAQLAFGAPTLYKPDFSGGYLGTTRKRAYFLYWKIGDQPDHVPNWDDEGIQAEVLRAWKFREGVKKATDRANALKAEVEANSGKPLADLPSAKQKDFTVLRPLPFSFLVEIGRQLQLGKVSGMEKVGPDFKQKEFTLEKIGVDFMKKVFSLEPNQADVITNLPKTEIYVVRAVEFTPFAELWSDFIRDADDWTLYSRAAPNEFSDPLAGLREMSFEEQSEVWQAWRKRVHADAELKSVAAVKAEKTEKPADQGSTPAQGPPTAPPDDESDF